MAAICDHRRRSIATIRLRVHLGLLQLSYRPSMRVVEIYCTSASRERRYRKPLNCGFVTRLHDTTCCQTGLTTGCIVYTNIQPFVKPVWQPAWQPVVSCIQPLVKPVVKPVVQPGLTTGWTNSGCSFNMVVKPVWQLAASCIQTVWQPVVIWKKINLTQQRHTYTSNTDEQ